MPLELKIPDRILDNFGDPIRHLADYVALLNRNPEEKNVVFDFTSNRFVTPALIGGVSCLINKLRLEDKIVAISTNEYIDSYLNTICFPDTFTTQLTENNKQNTFLDQFNEKTYIPIVRFPLNTKDSKVTEKILSSVNNLLKIQLGLDGNVLEGIYYLIDELTQNAIEHSGAEMGYLFAQFFKSKNFLDICITDSGKGIKQSYLDSGKFHPTDDLEAISLAMNGRSTKPLAESRGFGLSTSRRLLCHGLRGKFLLWSGNALMVQNIEREHIVGIPEQNSWQGCYICMRIPTFDNKTFNLYNFVE
jgi:anti-sigma regulatory factor (Ser/Thr protein kinase)